MSAVLEGVKILDLSRGVAGSYAAMLLAEQGADCIKIEPPGKTERPLPEFSLFNRSKRSLTLNIEPVEGQNVLARLLEKTDIFIQDFGLEQTENLKIEYRALAGRFPRLIYGGITPWGEKGPLARHAADETLVAAFAGTLGGQGGYGQPPVFLFLPFWVYATSMLTAYAASLALFTREITGKGQKVETSLLAGALVMEVGGFLSSPAITPVTAMRSVQQGVLPAYRLYQCEDAWMMIACGNPTFWNKLCMALDRVDLLADPRFEGMPWALANIENRLVLTDILAGVFKEKPRRHWLDLLTAADVPCAPVNTRAEFINDPQVKHNQMIVEVDDYYYGKMRQMGIPLTLTDYPASLKSPAPRPGQHTLDIMNGLGYTKRQVDSLQKKGVI